MVPEADRGRDEAERDPLAEIGAEVHADRATSWTAELETPADSAAR